MLINFFTRILATLSVKFIANVIAKFKYEYECDLIFLIIEIMLRQNVFSVVKVYVTDCRYVYYCHSKPDGPTD